MSGTVSRAGQAPARMTETVVALDREALRAGLQRQREGAASGIGSASAGAAIGAAIGIAPPRPATPLPSFLQIEPVGQCNLRCRMCPIEFRPESADGAPPAFADFDLFARTLDQFPGLAELQLQGLGEPMMHPRFFDMVEHAARRGIRVSTNTNLTLVTPARAERCVTSGLSTMHVSIDGASRSTYEAIRLRASFDKVLRNLGRVVEARKRLGSATPHLRWVMVVMRRNLHELPEVVRIAGGFGLTEIHVQHLCHDFAESTLPERYRSMREFVEQETLVGEDEARVAHFFGQARALAADAGIELRLPNVRPATHAPGTPGRKRCDWPWSGAYLSWDGQAMPCCMVATPDRASFGSVARDGVGPVWNSAAFEAFRARLDSDEPPEICRSCAVWHGTF